MSLLIPALGAAGLMVFMARRWDEKLADADASRVGVKHVRPNSATYRPHSSVASQTQSIRDIRSMHADVDLHGVPYYHVQYANGAMVKQYNNPYAHY